MSWGVAYYRTSAGRVPAEAFLDSCPAKVEATILAVLEAVRAAPPPAFSGGGKREAMHGSMGGYYGDPRHRPRTTPLPVVLHARQRL